jgi:valyl-tRNA synthetase
MSSNLIDKGYEPHDVEKRWYAHWEEEQLFAASDESNRKSYAIVIPPPNVTGVLHMGHALNNTMQDILCRYRRLKGDNVLWMPGTDHAGIATQNVVEKKLAADGLDRHQVGRQKFIEAVWEWRKEYGDAIINQLKRLGASCDWKRERFTMDEGLSLAVRKVFIQLYEEGLIYRGQYIINWCHRCHTALSDLEVEHEDIDGHLYHFKYPFADGSGHVVIATTRPETMLGDTAVAANPDDERYLDIGDRKLTLPLMEREIPFIKDKYVDMSFGTGALKITPAHDPNDFEIGRRHGLPSVKVIDDDGVMTKEAGRFAGMDRFDCRKAVVQAMQAAELVEHIEPHAHSVGHCYRCKTIVEPNLSKQWFVKAKPLAEKAIEAVESGKTRIIPPTWEKTYYEWMYNIRDWCISRQIWWGHQIPAWTCDNCGQLMVRMEAPEACESCAGKALTRETDVLDTWFSSALWPFSTMGWPDNTPLLKTFYPTSVLVTGFDILFFWVARMMMMGIHFMKEIPFKDVYVHALVRDEHGKKMSKSKGNVIDPLNIIDKYGTDAFRFTLAAFAAQGRDVKMSEKRVEGYRNFVNKLWNASRFSLMHLKEGVSDIPFDQVSLADKWVLSRLGRTADKVSEALDDYRFNEAASAAYNFVWHEFCDWYIEAAKPALYGKKGQASQQATLNVLWRVLRDTLVLLHPFMPFVTEEIWHKLPGTSGSIMKTVFPTDTAEATDLTRDAAAEKAMQTVIDVITGVRNIRGEMNVAPSLALKATLRSREAHIPDVAEANRDMIMDLAKLEALHIEASGEKPKASATAIIDGATIFASLEGIIDTGKESARLQKEIDKLEKELTGVSKKLGNEGFLKKAPEEIVAKVKEKHEQLSQKREKLKANLDKIVELNDEK